MTHLVITNQPESGTQSLWQSQRDVVELWLKKPIVDLSIQLPCKVLYQAWWTCPDC